MPGPLTRLQGQYVAFIHFYTKVNGRPPAEADIQRYFKTTPPAVHDMIERLERNGAIARTPGAARSIVIRLTPDEIPRLE